MKEIKLINELTKLDKKTLVERALKLSEEVGEVSESVLSYNKSCGCSYKGKTKEDVIEECVDTIIVALSIISQCSENDIDEEHINTIFHKKLSKWENTSLKSK